MEFLLAKRQNQVLSVDKLSDKEINDIFRTNQRMSKDSNISAY